MSNRNDYLPIIFYLLFTACLLLLAIANKTEPQNYYKVTLDDDNAIVVNPTTSDTLMVFDSTTSFYRRLIKDNE